jgi:hypothetical protein
VLSNTGARAGLLEGIEVTAKALGAEELVTGFGRPRYPLPAHLLEVGQGPLTLPRTVEAGDVRSIEINGEIEGPFLSEANTTSLNPPDLAPLAELVATVEVVEIDVRLIYRRRAAFRGTRSTQTVELPLKVPGERLREIAITHWESEAATRSDLVEIVKGKAR